MMRFIISSRIPPLRKMFVLALLLSLTSATADTVAFLDGSFLKPTIPETLSVEAYTALPYALTGVATKVSKNAGDELTNLIVDDIFTRPYVTWNVVLFGVTEDNFFLDDVISLQLTGDGTGLGNAILPTGPGTDCYGNCLVEKFSQGMETLEGNFASSDGLLGKMRLDTCGPEVKINDRAMLVWATELGEIWNDVSMILSGRVHTDSPLHLRSIMTGLYLIRRSHGALSQEFAFASCVTRETLFAIHKDLEIYFNRGVFASVLMHTTESAINDQALDEAMIMMGRQLLAVKWFSDSDPSKTVEEKTTRFSTNTAGYVISLLLWFASLGSIYALSNMDFTKDTLLYSQAKID